MTSEKWGPSLKNALVGPAEFYKNMLDNQKLRDGTNGVNHFKETLRPYFVKGASYIFMWRFMYLFRCWRGFYRGRSERSQTPARERRASTPRRTVRENTPTSEIPREGYSHENIPDEVLEFWNNRPRPSDIELRNPVLLERPGQPICDLCGRDTPFFCNLCGISTCGFCRITFRCDCSERWLSLGETLMRVFGTQETIYGREEDQQFTYEAAKEDHDSEQNRVVQRAHSQFRALRERVLADPDTTSGSGELDRLIRDDDRSTEEPYAIYGGPDDPLPSALKYSGDEGTRQLPDHSFRWTQAVSS